MDILKLLDHYCCGYWLNVERHCAGKLKENQMVSTLGFQKEDVIVWPNAGGSAAIEFQRLGTPVLLLFAMSKRPQKRKQ